MTLPFLIFAAVFLLVASGGLLLFYRDAALNRLTDVTTSAAPSGWRRLRQARSRTAVSGFISSFEKVLPRTMDEVSVIQQRLIRAGYRKSGALRLFYGLKVVTPLFLVAVATLTRAYEYGAFFVYGLAFAIGFLLPDFVLGNRIHSRQLKIRLGLPDALDLMAICIEAGMGLDQTIQRVAEELSISRAEISEEFAAVNLEQRAGRPRAEAWKNLAERTDVDSVRALVATLVQADQYGTSVSKALRVHSETLRTRRRQQVEEQAAKTAVKLVFPLVFFIFPSLFVVALGPAVIKMLAGFEKFLGS
jgi:Flp pilus assembly protein TadC